MQNMFVLKMFGYMVVVMLLAALQTVADNSEDFDNVIIGDLNDEASDVIGTAISEAEFEAALANEDLLTFQPDDSSLFTSPYAFFQGDIQIKSKDQLIEIMLNKETNGQSSAISNPGLKWPSAQIPYYISSHFSSHERAVIARAMAEYHQVTCIRFIPRTTHRNYIHILRGSGCSSMVGRVGGAQTVSLGHGCAQFGTVIHELMHASGFWHEQSRYDRDSYVTINWSNIWPGMAFNFNKKTRSVTQDFGLPYDYQSVMHYPQYAFARNRAIPTIYPRQHGARINGQHKGFSELDKKGLNLLYQCSGITPPKPTGCVDSNAFCSDWANKGQCQSNSDYMHVHCKKSCKKCSPKPTDCVDKNQFCSDWAKRGQCNSNAAYMKPNCPKSCNACNDEVTTNCVDKNKHCSDWAKKGQCTSNAAYMKPNCPKSCNACGDEVTTKCVDTNAFCPDWASKGQCNSNPEYMHESCKKSCNKCNAPKPKTTVKPTEIPITTTTTATTTTTTTAKPTETPKPIICKDDNKFCSDWATKGQCEANPGFMHVKCKKSCDHCNCLDDNEFCSDWATKGYCESSAEIMKEVCKRSCKICSTNKTTTAPPTTKPNEKSTVAPSETTTVTDSQTTETVPITTVNPTETSTNGTTETTEKPESCEDDNDLCSDWASKGKCESNAELMKEVCKRSCKICSTTTVTTDPSITNISEESTETPIEVITVTDSSIDETMPITTVNPTETSTYETIVTTVKATENTEHCEDNNEFCSDWASKGECESNSGFMHVKCKKSCGRCNIQKPTGNCLDDNEFCPDWATNGFCKSDAEYMKEFCKRSCKICKH